MAMTRGIPRGNLPAASQEQPAPESAQNRRHDGERENARPGLHFNAEEFEARERFMKQEARLRLAEEKLATQGPSFQQRVQQAQQACNDSMAGIAVVLGPHLAEARDTGAQDLRQVLDDFKNRNPPPAIQLRNMDLSHLLVSGEVSPDSDAQQTSQPPQKESKQ